MSEKDPKTDLVVGRAWKPHNYKLNSEETKLICYFNTTEVTEFSIELSKLTSINDIVESDQLSEPENSRYVWSILPLKILFACTSPEDRSNWITFIRSKLSFNPSQTKVPTESSVISQPIHNIPVVTESAKNLSLTVESMKSYETSAQISLLNELAMSQLPEAPLKKVSSESSDKNLVTPSEVKPPVETPSNEQDTTKNRTSLKTSQPTEPGFSIILRRFNKRGGVRVSVPDSMDKLLQIASEKLKITAVRIREVDTEAELSELNLLKPDMLVWVMTEEEELDFL